MPTYEFECRKCGETFLEVRTVVEFEKMMVKGVRCPKCHSRKTEQILNAQVQTSKKS
jgi:putative FmdB family regulatory protein